MGHVQRRVGTNLREYKRKGKGQKLFDGKRSKIMSRSKPYK